MVFFLTHKFSIQSLNMPRFQGYGKDEEGSAIEDALSKFEGKLIAHG